MAWRVKALATKSEDLSSVLGAHRVGRTGSTLASCPVASLCVPFTCTHGRAHTRNNEISFIDVVVFKAREALGEFVLNIF